MTLAAMTWSTVKKARMMKRVMVMGVVCLWLRMAKSCERIGDGGSFFIRLNMLLGEAFSPIYDSTARKIESKLQSRQYWSQVDSDQSCKPQRIKGFGP